VWEGRRKLCGRLCDAKRSNNDNSLMGFVLSCFVCQSRQIPTRARLSCLVLSCLECTLWEGFFWRMPKQAYTVRAEHHTPVGRVLRSYALEPSRGIVWLLHMYCPSSTIKL